MMMNHFLDFNIMDFVYVNDDFTIMIISNNVRSITTIHCFKEEIKFQFCEIPNLNNDYFKLFKYCHCHTYLPQLLKKKKQKNSFCQLKQCPSATMSFIQKFK